ncbi:hypothetical protein [Stieleria magnilauensis]|uniref:Uncharacterized protein n=1 Tax=Stieleria magnilauensis TaxID=2527963 RepID=A0ABX5XYA6_9BACT|nr:hypothetical protein TBK1r_59570 [Planctomycetes bacterium TBK1r]QDV87008.1 hypothetical protein TBK1r_60350 [Planctomycetes bacterium TBK1r]
MAGRKGQRSGGHNKKTDAEKEMLGTLQACRSDAAEHATGSVVTSLADLGIDAGNVAGRLSSVCETLLAAIEGEPTDKEARLSFTAYWDRLYRLAADLAREAPKDESEQSKPSGDGAPSMADLIAARDGST